VSWEYHRVLARGGLEKLVGKNSSLISVCRKVSNPWHRAPPQFTIEFRHSWYLETFEAYFCVQTASKNEAIQKHLLTCQIAIRFKIVRLTAGSSFGTNLLTRPEYSVSTFWPGPNTRFQHSDSAWYRPRIDTRSGFPIRLAKKSKLMSNAKIYYFWIYYVIIFERLTWNKWIYFSSHCLHYLVALSIKYIARCLILIRHINYQDLRSRKNLIS